MLKKTKMVFSVILAVAVLFCTAILMLPKETNAGTKVVAIEGVSYHWELNGDKTGRKGLFRCPAPN